jgi:integrase/recombinase XerD
VSWCEGQGVELATISPGMVGQYVSALGGSAAKRNLHLSALRGFFDRLVQRHVVLLNPAASVSGVMETIVEGKTPEITIDQARKLIASVRTKHTVKAKGQKAQEVVSVVGLRDRAILATLAYTACRAVPGRSPGCGFRISSTTANSMCCGFRKRAARAGKSPCGLNCSGIYWPIWRRRASGPMRKTDHCFGQRCGRRSN